jgi:hypothetical protein
MIAVGWSREDWMISPLKLCHFIVGNLRVSTLRQRSIFFSKQNMLTHLKCKENGWQQFKEKFVNSLQCQIAENCSVSKADQSVYFHIRQSNNIFSLYVRIIRHRYILTKWTNQSSRS